VVSNRRPIRLKSSRDFEKIKAGRKSIQISSWLVCNFLFNNGKGFRVGWTVPGYVGTAVIRNRLKRWLRQYLVTHPVSTSLVDVDVNIVFRRKTREFYSELTHEEFDVVIENLFQKIQKLRR